MFSRLILTYLVIVGSLSATGWIIYMLDELDNDWFSRDNLEVIKKYSSTGVISCFAIIGLLILFGILGAIWSN